jgi:SAM-dependent methyltransferase
MNRLRLGWLPRGSEEEHVGEAVGDAGAGVGTARSGWTAADTERVSCCLCKVDGLLVTDLAPFALVRCPVCDLRFISPRLTSEALQRLYDEPAYFEGGVYGTTTRHSPAMTLQRAWVGGRLDRIAQVRAAAPRGRLLEIGSGYGFFLEAARNLGYDVAGVELSHTGSAHSRTLGLDVFCGQLEDAPIPTTGLYDVVCFWDTLEHVPDPLVFLRAVRARLADDGVFALSVPYISSVPGRLLGARWWTLKPEQHIWHFTPTTLRVLAARAGLVINSVVSSPLARANVGRLDSLVAFGRALPAVGP